VPEQFEGLTLAIDTASDVAGVALFESGSLLAESTWRTRQSHSRQLMPTLDWLLNLIGRTKSDLAGIAVCIGPGSYAGMRVGLSTGKALSYALDLPLVGIGRLAADALPVAEATQARVVPVQAAGRAELAFAAYRWELDQLGELIAPGLGAAAVVAEALEAGDIVCGEVERLDEATIAAIASKGGRVLVSGSPRVVSVGRLGLWRLARGEIDSADALVPLYLRAPAIGPQPPL
jgi:tRNA threonylcarbamoyladenosine biosynthesis protein TsaB